MKLPGKRTRLVVASVALVLAALAGLALFGRPASVATHSAAEGSVALRIAGPGTVEARIPITLSARITATVAEVHADQGDTVARGQLLAVLDDRELDAKRAASAAARETVARNVAAAQAALAKADAELQLARVKFARDETLLRSAYISQAAMDASAATLRSAEANVDNARAVLAARESEARGVAHEARYAETVLSYSRIEAPASGIVIARLAEVGTTVVPGTPLFRLVDPATVWVAVRIDESVVGRVIVGQRAEIRLRTGETLPGKVARIARQSDAATRELEVDVSFDAPPARFAIDQEAVVTVHAGEERGIVVSLPALMESGGKAGVLVVEDGRARFRPIETGAADGERVIVRKGLGPGDAVIARPAGVAPGARVRAATG
jgi:RND family efflux transporter MFP subunit